MKKGLIIGLVLGVAISLATFLIVPVFAEKGSGTPNGGTLDDMHRACQNGDWDAMTDAAKKFHGDDFNNMPCHGGGSDNTTAKKGTTPRPGSARGGMMGGNGGMMGGSGGMMGGNGGMMGGSGWGTW